MKLIGIYQITGPNNKIYIGSSNNIKKRWQYHKQDLDKQRHGNAHLQRAYNKYGKDAFSFKVLEIVNNVDDLERKEQIWLDILFVSLLPDEIYNMNPTATGARGFKWTDAQIQRHTPHLTALAHQKAKTYTIYKDGDFVTFTNLDQYCRDNGLKIRSMRRMLSGERHSYKGYTKQ